MLFATVAAKDVINFDSQTIFPSFFQYTYLFLFEKDHVHFMDLIYFIHFQSISVAAELNNYTIAVINLKWFFNTIACKLFETRQRGRERKYTPHTEATSSFNTLIFVHNKPNFRKLIK